MRKSMTALAAALMAVTLGPRARIVAVSSGDPPRSAQFLSSRAVIALRNFGLPEPFAASGALLSRARAWPM